MKLENSSSSSGPLENTDDVCFRENQGSCLSRDSHCYVWCFRAQSNTDIRNSCRRVRLYLTELFKTEDESARRYGNSDVVDFVSFLYFHERYINFWYRILHQMDDILQQNFVGLGYI